MICVFTPSPCCTIVTALGKSSSGSAVVSMALAGRLQPATVVGDAPCEDLAVLKVSNTAGMKTMPLDSQSNVKEGDDVVALGYPQSAAANAKLTATTGVVSVAKTQYNETVPDIPQYGNVIQIDAALNINESFRAKSFAAVSGRSRIHVQPSR